MKRLFSILLVLIISQLVIGQSKPNIDSLSEVIAKYPTDKSTLIALIDYYKAENIDSLKHYVKVMQSIADEANDGTLNKKMLLELAASYLIFNKSDSAQMVLQNLSIDVDSDSELYINFLIVESKVLSSNRQFEEALGDLYQAVDHIKKSNLINLLANTYTEIAFVLSQNNDLKNCVKYYGYAFSEAQKQNNSRLQVDICYRLCRAYNGGVIVNLDSSVFYGELGLKIAKEASYDRGYADMLNIVSAPIIRNGDYRRGLNMSREALLFADKYSFSAKSRYYLTLNQGFAYEKLGIYDSAMLKMEEGAVIRSTGIDHFRLKYLIHKAKGEFGEALLVLEIYQFKKDSIIRGRNEAKLSSLQARHEANRQEQEVEALTQKTELQSLQLSQQRYFLGGFAILVLFLLTGGILIYRQRKLKQQQSIVNLELKETKKRLEIEKQYRASELKALRSQMNPHFVFNALNSIQEYIMLNEKRLAGKYLGKFADLMRIYLRHSQAKTVTVTEEIHALELYLQLEKLRFEDSLTCSVQMDAGVEDESITIPSLLLQPYVENALKHGLFHKMGDRKLKISFKYGTTKKTLLCVVEDNGVGRKKSMEINNMRNPEHQSFATNATRSRMELLNYDNERAIGEQIEDLFDSKGDPNGTRVVLTIPISE